MSFLKMLFSSKGNCPLCQSPGRFFPWSFHCSNADCRNYLAPQPYVRKTKGHVWRNPATGEWIPKKTVPITDPIEIEYLNFREEKKIFTVQRDSFRKKSNFRKNRDFLVNVAPSGIAICLRRDRVLSTPDSDAGRLVKEVFSTPTKSQQECMRKNFERGTTSKKYEALKARYPDWKP